MADKKKTEAKKDHKEYTFSSDEFLYVSEHRALIEVHDNLIRRFISAKVLNRLSIDPRENFVKLAKDGNGIEVYDMPKPEVSKPEATKKPATKK